MSQFSDESTTVPSGDFSGPGSLHVEDPPFALVPEWVIDTDISDAAFRVYSLLLRYGNTSGQRMPSRKLLAVRLHRSVDTVDRAVRELVDTGLLRVEHRRAGRRNLTNRYHLTTHDPDGTGPTGGGRASAPTPSATPQVDRDAQVGEGRGPAGSRTPAATPDTSGGRRSAGRVAAELRPDPEKKTQEPPPPNPPPAPRAGSSWWREEDVLIRCGITDLDTLVERCRHARQALDKPTGRWTRHTLHAALQLALTRGWPPDLIESALLTVAADPDTRSPMRLAEAGPWWDTNPTPPHQPPDGDGVDLAALEAELDDVAEHRPSLQAQARQELTAEHVPLTRSTVVARAVQILHRGPRGDAARLDNIATATVDHRSAAQLQRRARHAS